MDITLSVIYEVKKISDYRNLIYSIKKNQDDFNLVSDRVKNCGNISSNTVNLEKYSNNRSKLSNIYHCGNVWGCPICSAKIIRTRQNEIQIINSEHIKQTNGSILLVTLTVRHNKSNSLKYLLDNILKAFKKLKQSRTIKDLKEKFGIKLSCRSLETTWGKSNGYHVHIHNLFYLDKKLLDRDLDNFKSCLYNCWFRLCKNVGLGSISEEYGVNILDGINTDKYIIKYGLIKDNLVNKKAKNGNFTIWELQNFLANPKLLDSYDITLDCVKLVLKTYFKCFFGKKLLTWSDTNKLKAKYLKDSKMDKFRKRDIINSVLIDKSIYKKIRSLNKINEMLTIYELKDIEGLHEYLKGFGFDNELISIQSN